MEPYDLPTPNTGLQPKTAKRNRNQHPVHSYLGEKQYMPASTGQA